MLRNSTLKIGTDKLRLKAVSEDVFSVYLTGSDLYIRQPLWNRPTLDSIRRFVYNPEYGDVESENLDLLGQRFVDSATADIATAWAAGEILAQSTDNGGPLKYNNMYLAGGHGLAQVFEMTCTGHGLTNADIGDQGLISAKTWVLIKIKDAKTFIITAANTGANVNRWAIQGTPAATGTITFTGAGAKVYTAINSIQAFPFVQEPVRSITVDSVEITGDGTYYASDEVVINETYRVPNPAQWLLDIIASKGTLTPKWLDDPSNVTQMTVTQSWHFDKYGSMTLHHNTTSSSEVAVAGTGSFDYFPGGWQHQSLFRSGHTVHQYIPDLAGTVGGYDFKNIADVTANAASVVVAKSDSTDTADPPSHFAQLLKTSPGAVATFGLAFGYMRTRGQGLPANRTQNFRVWQLSTAEKQYPLAVDYLRFPAGRMPAATSLDIFSWECGYKMDVHPTYTVDAVYTDSGKVYRVIDIHDTIANEWIEVPDGLLGEPITNISVAGGMTVHSTHVGIEGIEVSVTGGWGRAILEIG
jgi:hypothetical protein